MAATNRDATVSGVRSVGAADRGAVARRLIVCPTETPWNPYLSLLYEHLAPYDFELAACRRLSLRWLWEHRRGGGGVVHLHWAEILYRFDRGPVRLRPLASWLRLGISATRIAVARTLGYRIVWTVHQVYPHERRGRERDRAAALVLARLANVVIAHDEATAEVVRRELGVTARVVPHGSYVGFYPPGRPRDEVRAELGLPQDAFVFLCFGELRGYKGVERLLKAFRMLGPGVRLVVAGNPKDPGVRAAIEAVRDPRVVPLLQWIETDRVGELFGACDAAVLARTDGGTSGSLVLACSLGVPTVAANLPAYRDLAAWHFEPTAPHGLAAALAKAAADPDAAERGRRARAAVEEHSWARVAADLAALLR
jgi:glycosyltransferase involved in cell wall biosynthesis